MRYIARMLAKALPATLQKGLICTLWTFQEIHSNVMCMDDCPKTTNYNTFSRQIINTYAVYKTKENFVIKFSNVGNTIYAKL